MCKVLAKYQEYLIIYTIDYTVYCNPNTKVQYKVCIMFV